MRNLVVLFIPFIATLARLFGPGDARSIVSVSCGVTFPQAPTPDRESLPVTIARTGSSPAGWRSRSVQLVCSFRNRTEGLRLTFA